MSQGWKPSARCTQRPRWIIATLVSLTLNYRAQFDKIIRNASYESLVQKIKGRLEQEPS